MTAQDDNVYFPPDELFSKVGYQLTDADIQFFRENPDELSLLDNRQTFRMARMIRFLVLAVLFFAVSKLINAKFNDAIEQLFNSVLVDLIFEMGAALIGAVATLIFIENEQRKQYRENIQMRMEIRRRITAMDAE